ncbi:MAG TPA: glycosyltransferase family 39 protein [Anaerolineae bacterium]
MPLELIYIWVVGLFIMVALLYLSLRLRNRRRSGETPLAIVATQLPERFMSLVGRLFTSTAEQPVVVPLPDSSERETAPVATAATEEPLSASQLRLPVSAALLGGLLLVWLGQAAYTAVPLPLRWWVFGLMAVGAIAFLLAGHTAARQQAPPWLEKPVRWLAHFFGVSAGQMVLLLLAPCFVLIATLAAGHQPLARHWPVSLAAWALAIGKAVVGSWQRPEPSVKPGRAELLFALVLFFVAFLLRGVATAQIPATFSGDEGSAGLSALSFLNGTANNLFAVGWFSFPSLYFAIQSVGILLLGQTIEALRLVSALAGALAVVATYWLARSLFDRTTAALAAVYLAAAHYHIHFSRIGLNNVWDSLFGVLAILGLWHGWKTGRRAGFILCGLALGLGQYFYVSVRTLPLLFLIWAAAAWWRQRQAFRQRLPGLILAAFIALIVVFPLAHFFAYHPNEFNAPIDRVTILGERLAQEVVLRQQSPAQFIAGQAMQAALGFTHEPLRLLYNPGVPLLLAGAATLFLLGLIWAVTHFDLRYLLLFLPFLAVIISNALSQDPPASQRYILAMPLAAILLAVPLGQAARWMWQLWPERRRAVVALAAILMVAIALADLHYYFFDVYDDYVLGGFNTETATEIAYYLRDDEPSTQRVYFFGFPRMGYFSHSTIPYLAPHVAAQDVNAPLAEPPNWPVTEPTLFIFLPERLGELEYVRASYPSGRYQEFYSEKGQFLFAVYKVVSSGS